MSKPTKKFIDKKHSVTFQLVHRSQQDPLIADEDAPQRVLRPLTAPTTDREKQIEEQHKYGIYYNDDTNYLQHLKETSDNTLEWPEDALQQGKPSTVRKPKRKSVKLQLPHDVFASEVEEKEGMLSRAAPVYGPQLHLDPDIVAAMDEDFDYSDPDNQLEDNFIEMADGVASDQEFAEEFEGDSGDMDEVGSMQNFEEEETKSRFTNYSMTSSVIQRNEQLTLLDDRFEQMYAGYDENEIGALDCDEIEGHVETESDLLKQCADEFEKIHKREILEKDMSPARVFQQVDSDDDYSSSDNEYVEVKPKEQWDCESILSTYSNIYNHPKLIRESSNKILINKRTGIPQNVLDANKLTKKALDQLNSGQIEEFYEGGPKSSAAKSVISQISMLSIRQKDETPEERAARKKMLREYRRERRVEKKANALAFKDEAKKQVKISLNNRNNVQGNRIL